MKKMKRSNGKVSEHKITQCILDVQFREGTTEKNTFPIRNSKARKQIEYFYCDHLHTMCANFICGKKNCASRYYTKLT